jgi:hypothetical protein
VSTDSVQKGQDLVSGAHIATDTISEDSKTKHLQRVVLVDRSGKNLGGGNTTGKAPETAVSVTNSAVVALVAANANRSALRIIHEGATICFANTNETLANLKANGQLLYATQPFDRSGPGIYKGAVYACCPTGTGPTTVRILEEETP